MACPTLRSTLVLTAQTIRIQVARRGGGCDGSVGILATTENKRIAGRMRFAVLSRRN